MYPSISLARLNNKRIEVETVLNCLNKILQLNLTTQTKLTWIVLIKVFNQMTREKGLS